MLRLRATGELVAASLLLLVARLLLLRVLLSVPKPMDMGVLLSELSSSQSITFGSADPRIMPGLSTCATAFFVSIGVP